MKIPAFETKYNIGDTVYWMQNNSIESGKITDIPQVTYYTRHEKGEPYEMLIIDDMTNCKNSQNVFKSKKELIKAISN